MSKRKLVQQKGAALWASLFLQGSSRTAGALTFVVAFPLVMCILLSLVGVPVKGFGWIHGKETVPPPAAAQEVTVVDFTETPANRLMQQLFRDLDGSWDASSQEIPSAGLPQPMSCVEPAPTLSDSKAYRSDGADVQVTFAAYPAGLGAEMFKRLYEDTYNCKPSSTAIYPYTRDDLGVEAATIQASWSVNSIETTFFRRGDFIVFVASGRNVDSYGRAKFIDELLQKRMTSTVCANPKEGLKGKTRNAFYSGKNFLGLQERRELYSDKVELPELTPEQQAQGVEAVKVPGRDMKVKEVTLPNDQFLYPLWPELPEPVAYPKLPKKPKDQKLKSEAYIRIEDPIGPGCGWSFLSTVEPSFDEATIQANNDRILSDAQQLLDADGPRWQAAIQEYWTAYARYLKRIEAYEAYRQEVATVAEAWEEIHADWREYYRLYSIWEQKNQERLTFLANQEQAREDWADQKTACTTYAADQAQYTKDLKAYSDKLADYAANPGKQEAEYEAYREDLAEWRADPRPEEEKGPRPEDPTPVEPVEPTKPAHACPPPKPAILSEKAPKATPEPSKPADPRPADARD